METISPLSKVTPAPDTYSTEISETRVSFQGFYDQNIYTTTPCAPGQRDFSFTINPSPNNEIHLPSCEIVTQFRIKKADGTNIAASNQLGCLHTLGWSMFENSNLRMIINKKNYEQIKELFEDFTNDLLESQNKKKIESLENKLINNMEEKAYSELLKLKSQINRE